MVFALSHWLALSLLLSSANAAQQPVLVVGATGQTGSRVYLLLKKQGTPVRALVRNVSKAQALLQCGNCTEADGIYVGDVTVAGTLVRPISGAGAMVVATGPDVTCDPYPQNCSCPKGGCPIDVDWYGNRNLFTAFGHATRGLGQVALVSADSTTYPDAWQCPDPASDPLNGLFKLNAEAFLMDSGLPYTIVKPCGLTNDPPGLAALDTFHFDDRTTGHGVVARADIARLIAASLAQPSISAALRFDLCTKPGPPTPDAGLLDVLRGARFPWEDPAEQERGR